MDPTNTLLADNHTRLTEVGNKDGAPPASQDRVTDAPHEAAARLHPDGSVPTGAVDWEAGLRDCFNSPGFLEFMSEGIRRNAFPKVGEDFVSWSDWLTHAIKLNAAAKARGEGK